MRVLCLYLPRCARNRDPVPLHTGEYHTPYSFRKQVAYLPCSGKLYLLCILVEESKYGSSSTRVFLQFLLG